MSSALEWKARDVDAPYGRLRLAALLIATALYAVAVLASNPPSEPFLLIRIPLAFFLVGGALVPDFFKPRVYGVKPQGPTARKPETKPVPWPTIRRARETLGAVVLDDGSPLYRRPRLVLPRNPELQTEILARFRAEGVEIAD